MPTVTVTQLVNAPVEQVWEAWDDFANINDFNPNLSASFLINDSKPTGLGAQRQCDMSDGKNYLREKIVGYTPGRQIIVDIYESSMPLKSARATISMEPVQQGKARVTMEMQFVPGMGILGKLMTPMMKMQFSGMLGKLLKRNAEVVEGRMDASVPA